MTIAVAPLAAFLPREVATDFASVTVGINDTVGGTVGVACMVDAGGVPAPWTTPVAFTTSTTPGNTFVPGVLCPPGGPWRPAVIVGGVTIPAATGSLVGDIHALNGQSQAVNMWNLSSGAYTPSSYTSMYLGGSWQAPTGDGLIWLLNWLFTLSGVPQAVVCGAQSGSSLTRDGAYFNQQAFGGVLPGWWLDTAGNPWAAFASALAAACGGKLTSVLWIQGEGDCVGVPTSAYLQGLAQLHANHKALIVGRDPAAVPFGIVPVGWFSPTAIAPYVADSRPVLEAQRAYIERGDAYLLADCWSLPRDSGKVHMTPVGLMQLAAKMAPSMIRRIYGT